MAGVAVIKLSSISGSDADSIMNQIKSIAQQLNIKVRGPIPLPTKHIIQTTRKTPAADGSHTFERWELRVHKRMIKVFASDQALHQILRITVPDTVQIEISLS
ncbi:30S ribosomal protein S10p [Candidatus Mancarchaeum acidiphilum]|jgi:ribosomal protein uS10|uniref:Small ribosomal subunit protein uS10 n=1 Tax=Candidatus Mancarchaeum acidiphilum TaxID=1920749 RepID=A0A218NM63_9ARCH|nr:30S ribosomal protein S10 [Candidatus Mancarchaeum acidiphilum]ASI13558.1 30S ribosomal protein S10p [Candidatus Mancarchaeum acidiphilum]